MLCVYVNVNVWVCACMCECVGVRDILLWIPIVQCPFWRSRSSTSRGVVRVIYAIKSLRWLCEEQDTGNEKYREWCFLHHCVQNKDAPVDNAEMWHVYELPELSIESTWTYWLAS